MLAETERLQREFVSPRHHDPVGGVGWEAPVDVFEQDHQLTVWVALPGVAPDDIEITLNGDRLLVGGRRRLQVEPPTARIRRLEIPHGRLERQLRLPPGHFALRSVRAEHGCVRLQFERG